MPNMFKIEKLGDITVMELQLPEFLNEENEDFVKTIDELFAKGDKKFLLDMASTYYVSSLILASLVFIQKRSLEAGGNLVFCNVKDRVKEVMAMTNLDKVFNIKANRPDALKALGG